MNIPKLRPTVACPIIFETDGKRYIVPHWIEIDETVTREQVEAAWVKFTPDPTKEMNRTKSEKRYSVPNSKGDGTYTVTNRNDVWSCTCPAYGFRKKCKHIETVKSKNI